MITTFTDIATEIRELQAQLEEHAEANDGDITTFPLLAHLEELETAQKDKAAQDRMLCSLACMVLEYEDEAEAKRAQAKRITDDAAKVDAKAEGIRKFIAGKLGPTDKVKDDRVALSMRKSTAVELAEGLLVEALPMDLQTIKISANKTAIKKAIEAGQVVEGVELATRYNLQIK